MRRGSAPARLLRTWSLQAGQRIRGNSPTPSPDLRRRKRSSSVDAYSWLAAQRSGALKHDWSPIVLEGAGRRLEIRVSADAAKVAGYRENVGARGQQLLADALGAML